MPFAYYTKILFRLLMSQSDDYLDPTDEAEGSKVFSLTVMAARGDDGVLVPTSPATVTYAIGATDQIAGLYVKNVGSNPIIVKYTDESNANVQRLGEDSGATDNGDWMFVPKVDPSTSITIEGDGGDSFATVKILHKE